MKITWKNNWPTVDGQPLERAEYHEIVDKARETVRAMECNMAWMDSQITPTKQETLEIEAPKCCNTKAEYKFTSGRGTPYFKCRKCSRFFSIAEGVGP